MTLTDFISDGEISISGKVTGLQAAATNKGVIEKLRDIDADLKKALEAAKTAFDAHDHSAAGKGTPLGTGGADSFSSGAVTTAKLGNLSVSGAKLQAGSISAAKISDDSVGGSKIGNANATAFSIAASSTWVWNPGLGYIPLFHVESADARDISVHGILTGNSVTLSNTTLSTVTGEVVWRGN